MENEFLNKKWSERKSKSQHFVMLIVDHFTIANVLFWDFIIKYVKLNHGKVEETQF